MVHKEMLSTCCFLGHRTIDETGTMKERLYEIIEKLITEENIDTFLFGSKSRFDDVCLEVVTRIKEEYPYIRRVYVRSSFPYISESYREYLLKIYDDTYYPEKIIGSGRASYVERNFEMINKSRFCVFYYDENYSPDNRKSGTKTAFDYATKHKKEIINIFK